MNFNNIFLVLFELYFFFRNANALNGEGIVGGTESSDGKYPYVVSVQENGKHYCSGSIITEFFVVSAAHCVVNHTTHLFFHKTLQVVGGINDLASYSPRRHTSDVSKISVPQEFFDDFERYWSGDIALLRLKQPFNFLDNPNLNYLELPVGSKILDVKTAVVTGFGYSELTLIMDMDKKVIVREGSSDGKLRYANVKVWSQGACSLLKKWRISDYLFCAQTPPVDIDAIGPCDGDSGGPLVMNGKILIGVLSTGLSNCDESAEPSLYTRVSYFLDFIRVVLNSHHEE